MRSPLLAMRARNYVAQPRRFLTLHLCPVKFSAPAWAVSSVGRAADSYYGSLTRKRVSDKASKSGNPSASERWRSRTKPQSNGEGVETRWRPPKSREGHGEGIVQTTNPKGAAKAEVVSNQRVTGSIPVRLIFFTRGVKQDALLTLRRLSQSRARRARRAPALASAAAYQNVPPLLSSVHPRNFPRSSPGKHLVRS